MNALNVEFINIALVGGFDGEIGRKSNGAYALFIAYENTSQLTSILEAYKGYVSVLEYDEDVVTVTLY